MRCTSTCVNSSLQTRLRQLRSGAQVRRAVLQVSMGRCECVSVCPSRSNTKCKCVPAHVFTGGAHICTCKAPVHYSCRGSSTFNACVIALSDSVTAPTNCSCNASVRAVHVQYNSHTRTSSMNDVTRSHALLLFCCHARYYSSLVQNCA